MSNQKFLTAWLAITLGMFLPVASQQVPKENSPQHHSAKNASDQAATPQASDSSRGAGETSQSEYDRVVQQGRAQLLAGNAQSALTSGAGAINIDASRWEAYALAGGALMNLKRYEDAADNFSRPIDRAPADKQPALRDLRRQCFLAHSGPPPGNTSATQALAYAGRSRSVEDNREQRKFLRLSGISQPVPEWRICCPREHPPAATGFQASALCFRNFAEQSLDWPAPMGEGQWHGYGSREVRNIA